MSDNMENKFYGTPLKINYPEGSLLHDVRYHERKRNQSECFEVVYWDPYTKQLEVRYEKPIIDIWFLKNDLRNKGEDLENNPITQIPQVYVKDCFCVYCKPSEISEMIDKYAGESLMLDDQSMTYHEWYVKATKEGLNPKQIKQIMCENPNVFKGDLKEDVYFRLQWVKVFGEDADTSKVTKCFLDIETDVIEGPLNMDDIYNAPKPINAVTMILPTQKILAFFVLGPRTKNQIDSKYHNLLDNQIKEFNWLITHQNEFKTMITEEDSDNKLYLEGYDIRIHIFGFNEEINLIKTIFDYINKYRPWFVDSWNAKFDHNYLMNRISFLGYDPYEIIIPSEFKTRNLYYSAEKNSKEKSIKNSKDYFHTSTYSIYKCQERTFAQIRKSQQELRSYSLTYIGGIIANIHKLSDTKSTTFREFAYTDPIKFWLYNIRDVVVQLAIEKNVNDCESLYSRSYEFLTSYDKLFQETHICRNTRALWYEFKNKDKELQSCRLINDQSYDGKFQGAFVAPPENNLPTGLVLNGIKLNNMFHGALDADAKSYYPSTECGCNINPKTLNGKCIVDNAVFINGINPNKSLNQNYWWKDSDGNLHAVDICGYMLNTYKNNNICQLNYGYFNLPAVSDYFEYLDANL